MLLARTAGPPCHPGLCGELRRSLLPPSAEDVLHLQCPSGCWWVLLPSCVWGARPERGAGCEIPPSHQEQPGLCRGFLPASASSAVVVT